MNLKVLEQDSKSKMDKTEKREDLKSWISCTLTLSRDEGSVYLISKSFFLARFSLITGGGWRLLWCMPRNGLFFSPHWKFLLHYICKAPAEADTALCLLLRNDCHLSRCSDFFVVDLCWEGKDFCKQRFVAVAATRRVRFFCSDYVSHVLHEIVIISAIVINFFFFLYKIYQLQFWRKHYM